MCAFNDPVAEQTTLEWHELDGTSKQLPLGDYVNELFKLMLERGLHPVYNFFPSLIAHFLPWGQDAVLGKNVHILRGHVQSMINKRRASLNEGVNKDSGDLLTIYL